MVSGGWVFGFACGWGVVLALCLPMVWFFLANLVLRGVGIICNCWLCIQVAALGCDRFGFWLGVVGVSVRGLPEV